jgi:hypothetical protein
LVAIRILVYIEKVFPLLLVASAVGIVLVIMQPQDFHALEEMAKTIV